MKITVMGLGYIGLPTAITLAEAGFEVCGFDVNKKTIETLQGGHIHIVEPGLQEAFEKAVAHGHLHFSEELGKSDVFYISVPTPFFKDENGSHKADLRFVESAGRMAGKVLEPSNLVILESTVPPHTSEMLARVLSEESGIPMNEIHVAHCPERVIPGNMMYELKNNDRITRTPWAIDMMQCNQTLLHIKTSAHLGSRANQHADCTRFHFAAECVLFCGSVRIVNICDLVSRYTLGDQLIPNIVIRTETTAVLACRRGCCKVAEDKLCAFGRLAAFPCIEHVFHDHIELAARIVQQGRVSQPLIERELASVIGDSEHIVLVGCDCTAANAIGAFAEFLHHGLLCRCRLCLYIVVFHFRALEIKHIGGLNICRLPLSFTPTSLSTTRCGRQTAACPAWVSVPVRTHT